MELYMLNRQHGRMILESVEHAEAIQVDCNVKATNIILQALPLEIYALVSTQNVAKDLWERIQMLMQGTSLTKQERECKLYDAFDKFAYQKGETLCDFYLRFSLLLNDMNMYNMKLKQFQVNTKFLNTLPLNGLKPKLYDGSVIEKSDAIVIPDTEETLMLSEDSRSKIIEKQNDPKMTEKKVITKPINYAILNQLSTYLETQFVPQIELSAEQAFWSQYSVQTDEPNLSATTTIVEVPKELPKVSMVNSCLKKLKFHLASFDMNHMSAGSLRPFASGSGGTSRRQRVIMCYNCKEVNNNNYMPNHLIPQETQVPSTSKQSTILAQSNTESTSDSNVISYSKYMNESQYNTVQNSTLPALQDDLILSVIEQLKNQVVNCTKINQDNKQVNKLLTAELERQALGFQNPCYFKKAQQLKPKLYDGCVIEKSEAIMVPDTEETLMLAEESRSKMIEKQNDPQMIEKKTESSAEQAFWSQYSVQTDEPNLSGTTIVEVPKELPKVSMRDTWSSQESAPTFAELFEIHNLKAQAQAKDTVILKLKEKLNSLNGDVKDRNVKRDVDEIETLNIELEHKCDDLINKVNLKSAEVSDLNASLQEKVLVITALKVQLNKLKGKVVLTEAVSLNPIDPELLKVDVAPLVPKLRKNGTAHTDYVRHTQKEAATLKEVIESERLLSPLNTSLVYAYKYTRRIQELLMIIQQTCPCLPNRGTKLVAVTPKNKTNQIRYTAQVTKSERTTVTTPPSTNLDSNTPVFSSIGVNLVSSANGSLSQDNTKHNRIQQTQKKAKKNKIKDHLRTVKSSLNKNSVVDSKATSSVINSMTNVNFDLKCASCNGCLLSDNHDACVVDSIYSVNHMTGDRSQLINFVHKFLGTVKFGNDHMAKLMGYGDYQIGNVTISRVYYMEGLGYNVFFVGQFCDLDLEVAFRQHTCFIRNLDGVDLLTGSQGNNLYTLSMQDIMASSPICLLSKASKTKSWLWHRRLSHLNFGAINHLARQGLVRGLPKLKFEKDHLCSACAMGKSTRKTHKPKSKDANQDKLYLLHMDLCGPMRPALNEMTPRTISLGLMPTSSPSTSYVPPSRNDWDLLFQPMFDELLNPPPSVVNQTPKAIAPIAEVIPPGYVDSTGSPSSTTVKQDAPSTSNSPTPTETQTLVIP
nr:retrovirus-related Pol polyprotein from transposon TNT 1-94 [Tanacetum cinerariifolium]